MAPFGLVDAAGGAACSQCEGDFTRCKGDPSITSSDQVAACYADYLKCRDSSGCNAAVQAAAKSDTARSWAVIIVGTAALGAGLAYGGAKLAKSKHAGAIAIAGAVALPVMFGLNLAAAMKGLQ